MTELEKRQHELDRKRGTPKRGTPEWEADWKAFYARADVKQAQDQARKQGA